MNEKTLLYQITETSRFMMGFVLVTKENNAIVIDGGLCGYYARGVPMVLSRLAV